METGKHQYLRSSKGRRASKKVWKGITKGVGRTLGKEKQYNFKMLNMSHLIETKIKRRTNRIADFSLCSLEEHKIITRISFTYWAPTLRAMQGVWWLKYTMSLILSTYCQVAILLSKCYETKGIREAEWLMAA